jgi:hypothetical protein
MRCTACNQDCGDPQPGELFCGDCGHEVSAHVQAEASVQPQASTPPQAVPNSAKSGGRWPLAGAATAAFAVLAVVIGLLTTRLIAALPSMLHGPPAAPVAAAPLAPEAPASGPSVPATPPSPPLPPIGASEGAGPPPDAEAAVQHASASQTDGYYQQALTDASGGTTVEAANVHIMACANGHQFYVYQYVNRPGFRAVSPPDWGQAIGGQDFGTFQEAVDAACA